MQRIVNTYVNTVSTVGNNRPADRVSTFGSRISGYDYPAIEESR
jgi:hypothetical protein